MPVPICKPREGITAELVRDALSYEPETGIFRWRKPAGRWGRIPAGTIAGSTQARTEGYRVIGLGGSGKTILASHVAWLYMTGEWPTRQVDHINRIEDDDRWGNLRLATGSENKANCGDYANNTSGYRGVVRHGAGWRAQITAFGQVHRLGHFKTPEAASAAYQEARLRYFGSRSDEAA